MGTRFNLSYSRTDRVSGDTLESIDLSFENPPSYKIAEMIQKFLTASGYTNIDVTMTIAPEKESKVDDEVYYDDGIGDTIRF